ncbi:helix-turn-helix domain-containing protein [Caulobacter sp. RL271]|uniref:AraC family transcriptional regulator n=1 Tax=Caulobacter segnis TaxID=88688 RepID=A0ABY4ZQ88_9CAUL|nr:AraC family transcriptional regulator [Caulobacter segnis]USQ94182.1 AraC family transcriptional regulator [Caulobacter segnis]
MKQATFQRGRDAVQRQLLTLTHRQELDGVDGSRSRHLSEHIAHEVTGDPKAMIKTAIGVRDPEVQNAARRWRQELTQKAAGGRLLSEGLATMLTVHLFRKYGEGDLGGVSTKGGLGANRLKRVMDYIEAHLADDVSLLDLAGVAGLSPHHFATSFRVSTGASPHRFVINRRIQRGKELLLETSDSISAIALAVGFASHSQFTINFRKLIGAPPSQFRRENR